MRRPGVTSRSLGTRGITAALVTALACALVIALSVLAQRPAAAEETPASELATAIDDAMSTTGDGAAAVVVTHGDEVVERRLYGSADGSSPLTSDAAFSWGRISDELVWVAVMQLVEQGSLRLDDALSSRLPQAVDLPSGYGALTMLDLMNHTTGLNVSPTTGASEAEGAGTPSIVPLLASFDARGAYDADEVVAYSPYNVALAAAVVEQVSGQDICSYVREHILDPLGMDETAVSAGGRPSRMGSSSDPAFASLASRLVETPDWLEETMATVIDRPALTVVGTADDLATFAQALLSGAGRAALFETAAAADTLLEVSRTYPSSGIERIAHGLFALPGATGVYGTCGTSSGYTSALFVDPQAGTAAVAVAARSSALDEVLAAVRVALGVPDGELANAAAVRTAPQGAGEQAGDASASAPDASGNAAQDGRDSAFDAGSWAGAYQAQSLPAHGITKILSVFRRTYVGTDGAGGLVINFARTDDLGGGVVAREGASDAWDGLYRLYVGTASGRELAQVTSDACALPLSTLAIEGALLVGGALALVLSAGYAVAALVGALRARLHGRRRPTQVGCVMLAMLTTAAAVWVLTILLGPGAERVLLSLVASRALSLAYVVAAAALLLWLGVTRWRGTFREPRRLVGCAIVAGSAIVMVLNFVYWEMLP